MHVITAHARAGKTLEIDFDSLVRLNATLVFLMGLTALEQVMDGLLAAGIDPQTSAAVIENGTRGQQCKVVAAVGTLAAQVRAAGLHSPALIVVGRVCALSETLDWFTPLPLHGKTIVVTRPRARAGTLAERLRDLGANVVECPCIETEELSETDRLETALGDTYDWVALTSPAGVHAMVHALARAGRDLRALWGCKFAVIGPGTARELAQYGVRADLMPDVYDGAHLAQALVQAAGPDARVLILRAAQGTPDLPETLSAAGIPFADVPTYRTVFRTDKAQRLRALLDAGEADVVTFTSASTVAGFLAAAQDADRTAFTALCIGEQTARAARDAGMTVKIAKNATIDAMVACLLEE